MEIAVLQANTSSSLGEDSEGRDVMEESERTEKRDEGTSSRADLAMNGGRHRNQPAGRLDMAGA